MVELARDQGVSDVSLPVRMAARFVPAKENRGELMLLRVLLISGCVVQSSFAAVNQKSIAVKSVVLKLVAEVDVPSRDDGDIRSIHVLEGDVVKEGDMLVDLADEEFVVAEQRARLSLDIARRKADDTSDIEEVQQEIQVARADLARANRSKERFPTSVSDSEIEHMELELARSEIKLKKLNIAQQVARVESELKQQDMALATLQLRRRQILAPIDGMVVELKGRKGEWVNVGEAVARLIRIDRLRADGFVDASVGNPNLVGRSVVFGLAEGAATDRMVEYRGTVVFVSPEVDPVNHQVQIRAEIENPNLALRPGLRGEMSINVGQ